MKHTLTGSQEKTLMKLIIHPDTNKVRGTFDSLKGERGTSIVLVGGTAS